jgi:hypothetical protein
VPTPPSLLPPLLERFVLPRFRALPIAVVEWNWAGRERRSRFYNATRLQLDFKDQFQFKFKSSSNAQVNIFTYR